MINLLLLFYIVVSKMRPSSFPKEWKNESLTTQNKSNMVTQLWRTIGRCPKNSIPIIRTRREDILQAKSIRTYGKKEPNSFPQPKPDNKKPRTNRTQLHSVHISYTFKVIITCYLLVCVCIVISLLIYVCISSTLYWSQKDGFMELRRL